MKPIVMVLIGAISVSAHQTPPPDRAREIGTDEAVVQGRITDARTGRPVAEATVTLHGADQASSAPTDEQGRYEILAVPGEYRLSARAPGYVPSQYDQRDVLGPGSAFDAPGGRTTTGIDIRLQPAGAIEGTIFDERGEGLAGVEVELAVDRYSPAGVIPVSVAFAQSDQQGTYSFINVLPGSYYVRAYTTSARPGRDPDRFYRATLYPGVSQTELAHRVTLGAGESALGINVSLLASPTRRIAGHVSDATGPAVIKGRVRAMGFGLTSTHATYVAEIDALGRFEMRGLSPGPYLLSVIDSTPGASNRWASANREISVEEDVINLELRAEPEVHLEGRILRDPGATRPLDATAVRLEFKRRLGRGGFFSGPPFSVGSDGTFSADIPGGQTVIRTEAPAAWTVKEIRVDGVDVTDQHVEFGEGGRREIEIIVTDRITHVRGRAVQKRGRPASNVSVVVFAEDSTRWGEPRRRVRETRSGKDGQFEFMALPPDDYVIAAVDGLPTNAWLDPDVLDLLKPLGARFRLGEAEQRAVSLTVSPAPAGLLPAH
jgi:hypothetical protein